MTTSAVALRRRHWIRTPLAWHVLSLLAASGVLIIAGAHQWFFFDEWAFLIPSSDGDYFSPHSGHWSTAPILISEGLKGIFGLSTYWPYLAVSMLTHLALAHVMWRLMLRIHVQPWIATALAFMLMVLGAGAENILWAFQVGFMGAMLLGVLVILLVDRDELDLRGRILVIALSMLAITFSGTALPVLAAAGILSLIRRGFARTMLLLAPAALMYLVWFFAFGRTHTSPYAAGNLAQIGIDVPRYAGAMFVQGLDSVLPIGGLGAVCVFALLVWAVIALSSWKGSSAPAYVLLIAALLQALLTGYSRMQLGEASASSSRYVYAVVCLLLPAIGLAFTWASRNRASTVAAFVTFVVIVAGFNAALLGRAAAQQSAIELETRDRLFAALDLAREPSASYDLGIRPEPVYAPDVTLGDLLEMDDRGWLTPAPFDDRALLSTRAVMDIARTSRQPTLDECAVLDADARLPIPPGTDDVLVVVDGDDLRISVALSNRTATGDARSLALERGGNLITVPTDLTAELINTSDAQLCVTVDP